MIRIYCMKKDEKFIVLYFSHQLGQLLLHVKKNNAIFACIKSNNK